MKKLIRIVAVTFLLWTMVCGLWTVYAAVPHLLNYQGRLTDTSGSPLNGSYNLTFRIYDAETAGNLLWQETHAGAVIQKGLFGVLLGSVTNLDLPFDKPYFLEIKVGNEVMNPRQAITSAGYAIRAKNAESSDKIKADSADTAPGYLSDKVDNSTIQVNSSDKLEVKGGLAQYIKGRGNNYKIDCGSVSVGATSSAAISFAFTFLAAPVVVVTYDFGNVGQWAAGVSNITTTGATIYNNRGDATETIYWIAIGY
jgi:hypothetical protein